jgi:hypothetical protein
MSHAYGEVWKDGRIIGHFEYNGTADFCYTAVQDSPDEVHQHWRSPQNERKCTCHEQSNHIPVILYSDYGGGFHWDGQICEKCRCIVKGQNPWWQQEQEEIVIHDGKP